MSEKIAHAVSMRFGIGIFDPAWLDARLALFEATMLPALKAQTAEFDFEVLVDIDLPERWKRPLRDSLEGIGRVRDVVLHRDRIAAHRMQIQALARNIGADFVLSTRIDDDDSLTPGAFAALQRCAHAAHQAPAFIAIRSGVRYLLVENVGWRSTAETIAIGLSVLLPVTETLNIWCFNHSARILPPEAGKRGWPILHVSADEAQWLRGAHPLSDSDYTATRKRIMDNANVGAEALDAFPVDHAALARWRELAAGIELAPTMTHQLLEIESEIAALRKRRMEMGAAIARKKLTESAA